MWGKSLSAAIPNKCYGCFCLQETICKLLQLLLFLENMSQIKLFSRQLVVAIIVPLAQLGA